MHEWRIPILIFLSICVVACVRFDYIPHQFIRDTNATYSCVRYNCRVCVLWWRARRRSIIRLHRSSDSRMKSIGNQYDRHRWDYALANVIQWAQSTTMYVRVLIYYINGKVFYKYLLEWGKLNISSRFWRKPNRSESLYKTWPLLMVHIDKNYLKIHFAFQSISFPPFKWSLHSNASHSSAIITSCTSINHHW